MAVFCKIFDFFQVLGLKVIPNCRQFSLFLILHLCEAIDILNLYLESSKT